MVINREEAKKCVVATKNLAALCGSERHLCILYLHILGDNFLSKNTVIIFRKTKQHLTRDSTN